MDGRIKLCNFQTTDRTIKRYTCDMEYDIIVPTIGNDRVKQIWSWGKERMEDKKILLDNIDKIHTTEMGIDRIKRNLKIDTADVVEYCKNKVLDKNCNIYKQGKNWYCEVENIKITINSYSYTIITAHIVK